MDERGSSVAEHHRSRAGDADCMGHGELIGLLPARETLVDLGEDAAASSHQAAARGIAHGVGAELATQHDQWELPWLDLDGHGHSLARLHQNGAQNVSAVDKATAGPICGALLAGVRWRGPRFSSFAGVLWGEVSM